MEKAKIEHIRVFMKPDYDCQPDWLGRYSNVPTEKFSVDREALGECLSSRECRYFNAENVETDEQAMQNYKRMDSLNRGDWYFVYVRAEAVISTKNGETSRLLNELSSSGLYGIESDCDRESLKEIEGDQLEELHDVLLAFGFTEEEIRTAPVKRSEN